MCPLKHLPPGAYIADYEDRLLRIAGSSARERGTNFGRLRCFRGRRFQTVRGAIRLVSPRHGQKRTLTFVLYVCLTTFAPSGASILREVSPSPELPDYQSA